MNCSVKGCQRKADYKVILYDVYFDIEEVFFEQDTTCPFICTHHMVQNEKLAEGVREPRGAIDYPYTNQEYAYGFTIYQPIQHRSARSF